MRKLGIVTALWIAVSADLHAQARANTSPSATARTANEAPAQIASVAQLQRVCTGEPLKRFPFVRISEFSGDYERPVNRELKHPKGPIAQSEVNTRFTADNSSEIEICFDRDLLSRDPIYGRGDISLAAHIGNREVEVRGYAEVGKNYERFSPSEIKANTFLNTYGALQRASSQLVNLKDPPQHATEFTAAATTVQGLLDKLLGSDDSKDVLADVITASEIELISLRDRLQRAAKSFTDPRTEAEEQRTKLQAKIDDSERELNTLETDEKTEIEDRHNLETKAAAGTLVEAEKDKLATLQERQRFRANRLPLLRNELGRLKTQLAALPTRTALQAEAATEAVRVVNDLSNLLPALNQARVDAIRLYTFQLKNGQIMLHEQDAKAGDVLDIYLLHFPPRFNAANGKPAEVSLATAYIDEYGPKVDVADSFLLVKAKRQQERSNFKGAPGVSLLWSFGFRPGEGLVLRPLSPSIGVNVSYLDFDPDKEIEIGAGVVAGLFKNQIQVGYGWNLNIANHRPYWFIGFSFAKVKENLTGKKPPQ